MTMQVRNGLLLVLILAATGVCAADIEDGAGPAIVAGAVRASAEPSEARINPAIGSPLADWIEPLLPDAIVEGVLLGLKPWQWVGLFLLIFAGVVIDHFVRLLLQFVCLRIIKRQGIDADRKRVRRTIQPFGLLAGAVFWLVIVRFLGLSGGTFDIVNGAIKVFGVLAATLAAWRVTDLICALLMEKAKTTQTKVDDVLLPLLRKTLKMFILAVGVVYGAKSLQIDIWPLVASLGLGGVAFAFAAKDTVENFFGSVAVLLDRPFDVGDWVVIDNVEGTVESIGFRSTRVRTFYNSLVSVPNANLVRAIVDNYGRRTYRRWKTYLGVQYDTPPDKLIAFTEGIRELVRTHPFTRKDYFQVYCNEFATSSMNILLYVFHEVPDWSTELRERERLFIDIVRLADQLGVQFAFPTQTLHLYKEEHGPHEVQHAVPAADTDVTSATAGIDVARRIIRDQQWQSKRPGPVRF